MMPCQLLKCLEDKHNWDRSSTVKTNLQSFFSQLLQRELDIAIATSIEKYYAKWGGVDSTKSVDTCENFDNQECVTEGRAQELAIKLAEQLLNEKTDQVIQRVMDIINTAAPRCDCKRQTAAVYPCLVKQPTISSCSPGSTSAQTARHSYWKKTFHDVTQIKAQIDDLKKDTIKKEDLMMMENKITKLFQLSLVSQPPSTTMPNIENQTNSADVDIESKWKENRNHRYLYKEPTKQSLNEKLGSIKKKLDIPSKKKIKNPLNVSSLVDKSNKLYKKLGNTYAVNMCLCEAQKEATKSGIQEKMFDTPLLYHEYRTTWKQKNSKNVVSQNSESVKEMKPINVQMSSVPPSNGREKKIPISCNSNVTCFHKIPSNSSIDKLLIFLAKWKDDFKNVDSQKSLPNLHKNSLTKGLTKLNSNSNTNLKYGSKNNSAQNLLMDPAIETLPITISEYIGDINLDNVKSNECLSNSTKEIFENSENKIKDNLQDFDLSLKSSDNKYKKSLENKIKRLSGNSFCKNRSILGKNTFSINPLLVHQSISEKSSPNSILKRNKSCSEPNNAEKDIAKTNKKINNYKENVLQPGIQHTDNVERFPSDCDYYVKFLGVTLTNINSCKDLDKDKDDYHVTKFKYSTKDLGADTLKERKKVNYEHKHDIIHDSILPKTGVNTCQCEVKLDELKQILAETYHRRDEFSKNEDKALDIQNLKNSLEDIQENCVCCNNLLAFDESKDLEVNTFNLLVDHLKGRLEKFKSYYCQSSCISPDEEGYIFSSLLQKVKQVISEIANQTRYACSGPEQTENSWRRVRSLLQEYIKMKLKRVHCLYIVSEERKQKFILPNVLDKVYKLIEDDFERLKLICKCHSIDAPVTFNEREEDYIPEKENIIDDNSEYKSKEMFPFNETTQTTQTSNDEKLCKFSSNKSMILSHNISTQVSYNLGMETKSCDAMEKDNKIIQTTESVTAICNKNNYYFKPDCSCKRNLSTITDTIFDHCTNGFKFNDVPKYLHDSKKVCYPILCEVENNNVPELHQNGCIDRGERIQTSQKTPESNKHETNPNCKKKISTPYIGYTIDCSCNGQGNTCRKSTILQNNKRINNILNDTKEKLQSQNTSYILNSILKTSTTKHIANDKWIISDVDYAIPSAKNVRNSKVSVHNEEEIFLKYSNLNLNVSYNTTNTSDQRISINNDSVLVPVVKNTISECKPKISKQINKQDTYKKYHSILKENNVKSEPLLTSTKFSKTDTSGCDCSLVPVCHVKMFVKNIENKLIHSQCTCDSLNPKICPLHSNQHLA